MVSDKGGKMAKPVEEKLFSQILTSDNFLAKHRAYYLLKIQGGERTRNWAKKQLSEELSEEDVLRNFDILSIGTFEDIPSIERFFFHKNPYLVRGAVVTITLIGGEEALQSILCFLEKPQSRMIRRDLVGQLLGYLLKKKPDLEICFQEIIAKNSVLRGYFRDMNCRPPQSPVLSVYPANDYWALLARKHGYDYNYFKNSVRNKNEEEI